MRDAGCSPERLLIPRWYNIVQICYKRIHIDPVCHRTFFDTLECWYMTSNTMQPVLHEYYHGLRILFYYFFDRGFFCYCHNYLTYSYLSMIKQLLYHLSKNYSCCYPPLFCHREHFLLCFICFTLFYWFIIPYKSSFVDLVWFFLIDHLNHDFLYLALQHVYLALQHVYLALQPRFEIIFLFI